MKDQINKEIKFTLLGLDILIFLYVLILFIFKDKIGDLVLCINAAFMILVTFFSSIILGYKKDKKSLLKDKINNIFITLTVIYLIIIYIIGNVFGYGKFDNTILNCFSLVLYTLSSEIFRYIIVNKKTKDNIQIYFITFLFILIDTFILSKFSPSVAIVLGDFIPIIIVSIIKNILLSYTSYKFGYKPCLLYAFVIDLLPVLAPVYPNFSNYIKLVITIVYSSFIYYYISKPYRREELETANTYKKSVSFYVERVSLVLVFIIIFLVSGIFRYSMSAIASNSMYPALKKGDAVLIETVDEKNRDTLKKDMIVAFEDNGNIITHRIVSIELIDDVEYVITKGDNNDVKDVTKKTKDDIIGIVRFRIPYLGYPSVEISEAKNK